MTKPLFQKLKEYDKTMLPMHMPGHKRNLALSGNDGYLSALCADCDITEIAGFDNLAEPEGMYLELKNRAAKLFKSEEAYPLVNGSTCGILAAIYATVPYGGTVIVARNCHKSVYNGLQLVNAKVRYLMPESEDATGIFGGITPETVEEALREHRDVKLVIVTSPTYEGVISDMEGICKAAHSVGVPVLVDSAHGAHLGFGSFPKSAVECGADVVVQSLHKTLPCLTQTAMLHRTGTLVSGEALQTAVNLFQTSSPSYLLTASIDGCVGLLEERGEECFNAWQKALDLFYTNAVKLQKLEVLTPCKAEGSESVPEQGGRNKKEPVRDPGKIVISTVGADISGPELMKRLREEYKIELEMAAEQYVIAMTGMGDTEASMLYLADALRKIDATCQTVAGKRTVCPKLPKAHRTIGEAMSAPCEEQPIEKAVGRIATEHLWAYPPGIPVVVAGEEITDETVAYLLEKQRQGVELHRKNGSCKGKLKICVVAEEKRNL